MKAFLTILIAIFILYQSSFAAALSRKEKEQQEAQRKTEQLQQLLTKAAKSSVSSEEDSLPAFEPKSTISNAAVATTASTSASAAQASFAGLISSPNAVRGDNKISVPNPGKNTVNDELNNANNSEVNSGNAPASKPNLYDEAFAGVVNQMLPMTPAQIAKLREVFTQSQLAAATPPGIPPKPTSTSLLVNLSPQATPPVIRLGAGYITSLVFIDATGQPWPIAAYSLGDPSAFNIQWDHKGNTLLIQSSTFYKRSNLAVILRDLNTPVMVTLIAGQEAVDYRVDLRVPGIGPNAIFVQNGIPESANPVLLDVLNGIPPKGSRVLKISGGDAEGWLLENKIYLRTSLNVISPGWQSIMSSIDGTHAYQLQPSPIILAMQNGRDKILTLTLEGLN